MIAEARGNDDRESREAVVGAFIDRFREERLDELRALLAPGCVDENPVPLQPPGADGVLLKAALFHREHPGFQLRTESIRGGTTPSAPVEARWLTTYRGGDQTRWIGRFLVEEGRVARYEVERVG